MFSTVLAGRKVLVGFDVRPELDKDAFLVWAVARGLYRRCQMRSFGIDTSTRIDLVRTPAVQKGRLAWYKPLKANRRNIKKIDVGITLTDVRYEQLLAFRSGSPES